jgi:hypothetical protein
MPRQYIGALRGRYSSRTPALAYRGGAKRRGQRRFVGPPATPLVVRMRLSA